MSQDLPPELAELLKNHQSRVIVKFNGSVVLPYEDGAEKILNSKKTGDWQLLAEQFPGLTLKKVFDSETEACYRYLIELAQKENPSEPVPSLFAYYYTETSKNTDHKPLIDALLASPLVETAYQEGIWVPAGPNPNDRNPLSHQQGYLDAAPVGVDARFTHQQLDGKGAGIKVAHLDQGWLLRHSDLYRVPITIVPIPQSGTNYIGNFHGTAVLGILAANDNDKGILGMVPDATFGVAGTNYVEGPAYYGAFAYASRWCRDTPGSVVLLTSMLFRYSGYDSYHHFLPVESEPMVFDAIRLATSNLGISVIEAAGQYMGYSRPGLNLDDYRDERGNRIYDRSVRDSGAIMVAGAISQSPHSRWPQSNYGNRIDCFAWAENIATTGSDDTDLRGYTNSFEGTSGAAAIVAGSAVTVQGLAKAARPEGIFSPAQLRSLLSARGINTPSKDPTADRIGVMPNLRRIAEEYHLIQTPVPLYLGQDYFERMKVALAFAHQFLGRYGSGGPDRVLPGGIRIILPDRPVVGPYYKPTLAIMDGLEVLRQSERFADDEANVLRDIALNKIERATQEMRKSH